MKTRLALAAVLFILSATCTEAQTLGIFSSPKGFGVTSLLNAGSRSDAFDCLTVYADIYGLPMDRADYPGIKILLLRRTYKDLERNHVRVLSDPASVQALSTTMTGA